MAPLNHHIPPEHQHALRSGIVTWNEEKTQAQCGHLRGYLMWSENRIGWRTPEVEEVKWINTRMGVVPGAVVKRFEEIARDYITKSLLREATGICQNILDNADYRYKALKPWITDMTLLPDGYLNNPDYYYDNKHLLLSGMMFELADGDVVMLDRRVPGDGTDWYVLDESNGGWSAFDTQIHPGDLRRMLPSTYTPVKLKGA